MNELNGCLKEDSFSRKEQMYFAQCDRCRHARPATLLGIMAAMAGHDYDARGLTYDRLLDMGVAFLLSRVAMRVHRPPVYGDILDVTTWENGVRGPRMRRVYEMVDQNGQLCVSAKSEWILVEPVTHRLLRTKEFTAKKFTVCPKEIDCPDCRRLRMPEAELTDLGERKVVWSDLDGNGHVYSGNYGDLVWDFLPSDLQERPVQELYLDYNREGKLGEVLTMRGLRQEDRYLMEGVGPEGNCFTCECLF